RPTEDRSSDHWSEGTCGSLSQLRQSGWKAAAGISGWNAAGRLANCSYWIIGNYTGGKASRSWRDSLWDSDSIGHILCQSDGRSFHASGSKADVASDSVWTPGEAGRAGKEAARSGRPTNALPRRHCGKDGAVGAVSRADGWLPRRSEYLPCAR